MTNGFTACRYYTDYADYRIPIDTINYLSWKMPLYNQRVKNTAGNKSGVSFSMNYQDKKVNSWIHISDVYGKNGFFPGAHGIPDISRLKHDGNFRNVEMPYSWSNHLKFTNNTKIKLVEYILHFDLGFQQNHRQELSVFHTHYANQQPPKENPDLELEFRLNTLSSNINYTKDITSNYHSEIGISIEFQLNKVNGYSFATKLQSQIAGNILGK